MDLNRKIFILINIILLATLLSIVDGFSESTYFPEEKSPENLEESEKELDIRYNPSGPLYNDLRPNISKYTDEGSDQNKIPLYKVETNKYGARDDSFNLQGEEDRIVFLGDSFTFGWGVNKSYRYTEVAERNLDNKTNVQFMNLAVPGTGIIDYYLTLKHKGLNFDPDMAVVGLRYQGVRSVRNAMEFREQARSKFPESTENRSQKIQDFHKKKEEELLNKKIENTEFPRYVGKLSDLAKENDIDLVFYLIDNSKDQRKKQSVREILRRNNVTFIDVPDDLISAQDDELILRKGDSHYNQKAHRILGENLASELEKYY